MGRLTMLQDTSLPAAEEVPMSAICDEIIVRMGHDPSKAPRAKRVAVVFHQVPLLREREGGPEEDAMCNVRARAQSRTAAVF